MKENIIVPRLPFSSIRALMDAAAKMQEEGKSVIPLNVGRPDFDTPQNIVDAAKKALDEGKHHYCHNLGIIELRKAISKKYKERYDLDYNPENEVIVTNGVTEGIYLAIKGLLNPGDQILIPDPAWLNYETVSIMEFVEAVKYSLTQENGFYPDMDEIRSKITNRTKMLVFVNPSNPTGRVIPKSMIEELADIAEEHDLIILSDEIYEDLVYAPAEMVCAAAVKKLRNRTVVLNGFSKSYSMTGWRLGYAVGPQELIFGMLRIHQFSLTSVSTFAQYGAVEALEGPQDSLENMFNAFNERKEYLYEKLSAIPELKCLKPEGAFYMMVNVKGLGMTGEEASAKLLNDYGVVTVPGESFGEQGAGFIRIAYANSLENIKEAVARIEKFVEEVKQG